MYVCVRVYVCGLCVYVHACVRTCMCARMTACVYLHARVTAAAHNDLSLRKPVRQFSIGPLPFVALITAMTQFPSAIIWLHNDVRSLLPTGVL